MRIKDWNRVFHCAEASRAEDITWTKWPVSRNGTAYRRLMATAEGRTAFCVFVGFVRLCARNKTGGECTIKRLPITPADLEAETGIPMKEVVKSIQTLQATNIGWLQIDSESNANRPRIDQQSNASDSVSGSDSSSSDSGGCKGETTATAFLARLERVWQACSWRRVGKRAALRAIGEALHRLAPERFGGDADAAAAFLAAKAAEYAASPQVSTTPDDFLPHPATWFNEGRYDDDPGEWARRRGSENTPPQPTRDYDKILAGIAGGGKK